MGAGALRAARSVKPQINLNRKSEVYHTQKNMELLRMCEQPEAPFVAKEGDMAGGQDFERDTTNGAGEEAGQTKAPIFSVKMQTFDKTFQEGFNTYLKIGE